MYKEVYAEFYYISIYEKNRNYKTGTQRQKQPAATDNKFESL
jgi:hypothetical protein